MGARAIAPIERPPQTELCALAVKYGCDKCSWTVSEYNRGGWSHNYTPFYHDLFKEKRDRVRRVLEIGIGSGVSLHMWAEYFPNAEIIGVDNDVEKLVADDDHISSYLYDQHSEEQMRALRDSVGECDLIIDDGSHHPSDQIRTCNILGDRLMVGGVYVIEDILPPPINYQLVMQKVTYPWERRLFRVGPMLDDVMMIMWRKR